MSRRLMWGVAAALVCAMPAFAAPASAQETPSRAMPSALRDGRWGLSFAAFTSGGASMSYFNTTSSRGAFTLDVSASGVLEFAEREDAAGGEARDDRLSVSLLVAPGIRRYLSGRGTLANYFLLRFPVGVSGQAIESEDDGGATFSGRAWNPTGGVATGFGLEWFPTDAFSVRGEVVASGMYTFRYSDDDNSTQRSHLISIGMGQSALAVALWF